jgi:hypothetical protein
MGSEAGELFLKNFFLILEIFQESARLVMKINIAFDQGHYSCSSETLILEMLEEKRSQHPKDRG